MSRLAELTCKVDAFFLRVSERHGTDMQCATGCSDCCHVRLTITAVEAAAIRAHVAGWPSERRTDLAETGSAAIMSHPDGAGGIGHPPGAPLGPDPQRCAALDPAGRCKIYDARPLVCRSHGVPIRMRRGGLPVVQACHRNFRQTTADPDCILDQTTLSATLLAIDAAEARAPAAAGSAGPGRPRSGVASTGEPPTRVELAALLAELAAS